MIESLVVILLLQLLGEFIVQWSGAPVPGPVLGMVFMALLFGAGVRVPEHLRQTCQALLAHLSLLFVPAGVGVMLHLDRLSVEWLPLLAAIVVSTWLTLAVTAWVMQRAIRWQQGLDQVSTTSVAGGHDD
jgi:holin-like protein